MKAKHLYLSYFLLLLSFIFIPHTYLWDHINHGAFKLFNSSLYLGKPVQILWSCLNNRWNDWVIDVVFIGLFVHYIKNLDHKTKLHKFLEMMLIALVMVFTIFVINKIIFRNFFPVQINSPSVNYTGYLNINKLVPFIKSKVFAYGCFPGDHATTAILFYFITKPIFNPKVQKYLGIYIIFLILPRLVVGAHNFSDIILGSLPIAYTAANIAHNKNYITRFAYYLSLKTKALLFKKKTSPL